MIDVKNLMIGDWVYHLPNIPTKINSSLGLYHIEGNEDAYRPIPLTPEILEKNGFKLDGKYYVYDSCFSINYDDGLKECWLQIGNGYTLINYVHELQRALRLCGLSYVADNFRID